MQVLEIHMNDWDDSSIYDQIFDPVSKIPYLHGEHHLSLQEHRIYQKGGSRMATYIMFGQYSGGSVKKISAKRTKDAQALVKKYDGKVRGGYAMLGEYDLLLILEAKNNQTAMQISIGLSKLLDIAMTTAPAVSIEEFDKLMKNV